MLRALGAMLEAHARVSHVSALMSSAGAALYASGIRMCLPVPSPTITIMCDLRHHVRRALLRAAHKCVCLVSATMCGEHRMSESLCAEHARVSLDSAITC